MLEKGWSYGVFRYWKTQNLGDAIQTVALSRLLPGPLRGVNRQHGKAGAKTRLVANGWLGNNTSPPLGASEPCLFAGVFVAHDHNLSWLRRSPFGIGARDPFSEKKFQQAGLNTEMIGCSSLTLPRYEGRRSGIYVVDSVSSELPTKATRINHHISRRMSWRDQWSMALDVLDLYRKATVVYTSRLHVALPCIAFGTPLVYAYARPEQVCDPLVYQRVSLLRFLGVRGDGSRELIDPEPLAKRYRLFLQRHLEIPIVDHDPRFPT